MSDHREPETLGWGRAPRAAIRIATPALQARQPLGPPGRPGHRRIDCRQRAARHSSSPRSVSPSRRLVPFAASRELGAGPDRDYAPLRVRRWRSIPRHGLGARSTAACNGVPGEEMPCTSPRSSPPSPAQARARAAKRARCTTADFGRQWRSPAANLHLPNSHGGGGEAGGFGGESVARIPKRTRARELRRGAPALHRLGRQAGKVPSRL